MRLFMAIFLHILTALVYASPASIEIQAAGNKVALPFWPAKGNQSNGALLLVQGGPSADGGYVLLSALADRLAQKGWSVAILTAVAATDKSSWADNIPEALNALRQKASNRMVLLHYGDQLKPVVEYFSKPQSKRLNGLVFLSAFELMPNKESQAALQKISFPLVDITGQFDYQTVLQQAALRQQDNQNKAYAQMQISGAEHDYAHTQNILAAYLHGWMIKLKANSAVEAPIVLP